MSLSKNLSASSILDTVLSTGLSSCSSQAVTIHAGHYALLRNRDRGYCDRLSDLDDERSGLGFEDFCRITWEAACRSIATATPRVSAQLMVLVNDWQFISPDLDVRRERERAISQLREMYYLETPMLPDYHQSVMERYSLSADLILRDREDRWLFSESSLRSDLRLLISDVTDERRDSAGVRKHFTAKGEPIIEVCDNELGNVRLLYCGNTSCAGEVVALLRNLYARGVRCFLNIYPSVCREPVNTGTGLAYRLFGLDGLDVTNIAVSGAIGNGSDLHAVVERFRSEDFSNVKF